jgi:hypothetical protein
MATGCRLNTGSVCACLPVGWPARCSSCAHRIPEAGSIGNNLCNAVSALQVPFFVPLSAMGECHVRT